jgi:dolichol-phosphate mannosyltransferase
MRGISLSVVVPLFNEIEVVDLLHRRLTDVLKGLGEPYEIVLVDDHSNDGTWERIRALRAGDPCLRAVRFSRNFGHQMAITAGLARTRGAHVVIIDGDLQDPPELIPAMLAKAREGYDVVYMVRRERRGELAFKRWTATLFYRLLKALTAVDIPVNVGDFRLVSRRVADALLQLSEHHRFMRGLVSWVGFPQTGMLYDRDARYAGTTKYPLRKMLLLAVDGISSFSGVPLRLAMVLGLATAFAGFLLAAWFLVAKLVLHADTATGWLSTITVVLFLGGVQLITIGILGEYLLRVFNEVKRRPLYIVEDEAAD